MVMPVGACALAGRELVCAIILDDLTVAPTGSRIEAFCGNGGVSPCCRAKIAKKGFSVDLPGCCGGKYIDEFGTLNFPPLTEGRRTPKSSLCCLVMNDGLMKLIMYLGRRNGA